MKFTLVVVTFLLCLPYLALAKNLTIVYPKLQPPFDAIYHQINKGIVDYYDGQNITYLRLPLDFNAEEVINNLESDRVIALGRVGYLLAKELYKTKPVIVGAVPIKPNGVSGVSLVTDPAMLFDRLTTLAPNINKVNVVYSPLSEWVIEFARERAKVYNLELNAVRVNNVSEAIKFYENVISSNEKNSAIWLPFDPITVNEKAILPSLLEKAWINKIVIFSSNPTHAKKGALFSALPNNFDLGVQLAKMVDKLAENKKKLGVRPLSQVDMAVNLRTATHLGYQYDLNTKESFSATFPR